MIYAILILAVFWVAFTNGANANFKGVASLYGSGTTTLRKAALWGTGMTFAGSLVSLVVTGGLLTAFGGKGLVPDTLAASPDFLCAVAVGGAGTSFFATRLGFPVSTTHALVGALVGAGLAGHGDVRWTALGNTFVYPLLFSPLLAALIGGLAYVMLRRFGLAPSERTFRLDIAHYLSTGAASFARGLNDTPKITAPLLVVPGLEIHWAVLLVAVAIMAGGLLDIRNVAETLGKKVTGMDPGQGFAASLVTSILVSTASFHAMPVSTTHVSVGSLIGIGAATQQAHWRKVSEIILAWLCTVPCGALLAAGCFALIRGLPGT